VGRFEDCLLETTYELSISTATTGVNTGLGGSAADVVEVPRLQPRIMRYELSDFDWTAVKPMLPNTMRGVLRTERLGSYLL
jgi:hypothetical protein